MKLQIVYPFLFGIFGLCSFAAQAQDQTIRALRAQSQTEKELPKRDSGKLLTTGGIFTLIVGQGSLKNWAAGGDVFSFSLNSYFGLWARYKKDKISWDNNANFNYGVLNTTSQGTRKNDDRIDMTTKLGYALADKVNVSFLTNFQSQFSKGYKYKQDDERDLLSNFMAPGYLLISLGIDYKPVDGLSIFVSPLTSRWVFVMNDSLSSIGSYGVSPGKHVKNEIGAFASITYNKKITPNISYIGKLDLFSNYKDQPQNVDLLMNHMLNFKISKVLSANFGLDLIYDDNIKLFGKNNDSPGLQIRQATGIGLTVNL